jgi:hypothetical protein
LIFRFLCNVMSFIVCPFSFGCFVVCPLIYGFLPFWYLQSLVFCVMLWVSLFVLLSFFIWLFCCLSIDIPLLLTLLVSSNFSFLCNVLYIDVCPFVFFRLAVLLSVHRTASSYPFSIFKLFLKNVWIQTLNSNIKIELWNII